MIMENGRMREDQDSNLLWWGDRKKIKNQVRLLLYKKMSRRKKTFYWMFLWLHLWSPTGQWPMAAEPQQKPGCPGRRDVWLHLIPPTASWRPCGRPPSDRETPPTAQLHPDNISAQTPKMETIKAKSYSTVLDMDKEKKKKVILTLWSATPRNAIAVWRKWVRALSWCPSAGGRRVKEEKQTPETE